MTQQEFIRDREEIMKWIVVDELEYCYEDMPREELLKLAEKVAAEEMKLEVGIIDTEFVKILAEEV